MTLAGTDATQDGGEGARTLTAAAVAKAVSGRLIGDPESVVRAIAPLDRAGPDDLSFLASARYSTLLATSRAGVVLVAPDLAESAGEGVKSRVVVEKPHDALLALIPKLYRAPAREPGIHPTARIGRGVALGENVTVGAYAVIEDGASVGDGSWIESHVVVGTGVVVGRECRLHPGVALYPGARLGDRVQVHSGARIGSDGFGYVFRQGAHEKIPHVGRAIVENDVEIGANTTIDRGSIDDTVIGAGTKIDNLVHIGHNVRIGKLCLVMAQVGVAGSAHIEDGVILAGQAGLGGHIHIGKGARVAAQAGVFGDVPAGESWSGYPARPHRESLRSYAALFKLAGMIRGLEKLLARSDA
ncbi:MAG: UDP-3-O-(3-hydroxymyristoyl)glucosamine N-acyltransferase [Gemmatimonadaceae bacterium]|nr:UDP-3-O-(3-hydroxymyristoyl)glucosamine N-acyltransferase [Gemmatimonadaceae bacterium]